MSKLRGVPAWVERGELKVLDGDVLGIVQQVKAISDRLDVYWNEYIGKFTITEHQLDGTESLVFHADELDQRVIDRLRLADQWRGREDPSKVLGEGEDFVARLDEYNEKLQARIEDQNRERLSEAIERFGHAMGLDGRGVQAQILVKSEYGVREKRRYAPDD